MKLAIKLIAIFAVVGLVAPCPDEGYDYLGFKDCKHVSETSTACATFCANHSLCFYWTWNKDSNACCTMVKKNFKGKTVNDKMISGDWVCKD